MTHFCSFKVDHSRNMIWNRIRSRVGKKTMVGGMKIACFVGARQMRAILRRRVCASVAHGREAPCQRPPFPRSCEIYSQRTAAVKGAAEPRRSEPLTARTVGKESSSRGWHSNPKLPAWPKALPQKSRTFKNFLIDEVGSWLAATLLRSRPATALLFSPLPVSARAEA